MFKHLLAAAVILVVLGAPMPAQDPPPVPDDVAIERDLEYSSVGGSMKLDVLRPANGAGPFPAIVLIHGGGFRRGERQSQIPLAIQLAQHGYVAAPVTYRLSPTHQFPAPVHDVKAAVRFLRANAARFQIDAERIGATGGSAGGHLTLFLGLTGDMPVFEGTGPNLEQSSRVQAIVNYYGPTDFTKSYGKSVDAAEVLPLFLGGDLDHDRAAHIYASPLNWVTPLAAPTLSIHGTVDRFVEYQQSVWLTDRLREAGVTAELITLEGVDHGFRGADRERADTALIAFFDKQLAPKPQQRTLLISDHGPRGEIVAMEWPSGKELWTLPNNRGHDVQALPNGHVLYTTGRWKRVVEVDAGRREVWSYGLAQGLVHPISAQRLANGNTLIGDAQLGKVIEVTPQGKTVWEYAHADLADMQLRHSGRTPQGTTLISIERQGKIIEVDQAGKIVWTFETPGGKTRLPYQAHRLPNGNTLIGMTGPGEIVEVEKSGKIVRSIGGERLDVQMGWVSGTFPLENGGVIVSDYTGRRLIEFNAKGQVVNELRTGPRTVAGLWMTGR